MESKTIICDIDGCIAHHNGEIGYLHQGDMHILPGVKSTFKKWDINGNNIILLTGRRESVRSDTERQLSNAGIFYDQLIMGVKNWPRVIINDRKVGSSNFTAYAVNLERNCGMENINIGEVATPWGKWEVLLDSPTCKVKIITICPGQAPSYQYHHKREEHWTIVSGTGEALLDDKIVNVIASKTLYIPMLQRHQLRNTSNEPLIFIETQLGNYFGEDDIIRIKDDYGRL